jgi:hypothetical protein
MDHVGGEDLPPVVLEKPININGHQIFYDVAPALSKTLTYNITLREDYYSQICDRSTDFIFSFFEFFLVFWEFLVPWLSSHRF